MWDFFQWWKMHCQHQDASRQWHKMSGKTSGWLPSRIGSYMARRSEMFWVRVFARRVSIRFLEQNGLQPWWGHWLRLWSREKTWWLVYKIININSFEIFSFDSNFSVNDFCFFFVPGECDKHRHRIVPFDPSVPGIGYVEVQDEGGSWGLVCDDNWGNNEARVFCNCLGFDS